MAAAAVIAVRYIYREMDKVSQSDTLQEQLQQRRNLITRTLYNLYRTESYGQLMLAGYDTYEGRYAEGMKTVLADVDSLKGIALESADSVQIQRIDSISMLLVRKAGSTMRLKGHVHNASAGVLYQENIERILSLAVPVGPDSVRNRVVVERDSSRRVDTHVQKKGFFRRLADAFSPVRPDTSVVITRSTRIVADSSVSPADTIAGVLRGLQGEVVQQRQDIYDRARRDGTNLRYSNQVVTEKINRLILGFEQDENRRALLKTGLQQQARRQALRTVGGIAIGAVVLMLVLLALIWRDIGRSARYRRELEEANRYARQLLAVREQLMLTITHDIKAPLGSVIGYIDLLSRLLEDKRQRLYLQHMKDSSEHLFRLVNQLLDFHRLDSHKMEVARVAFIPEELFGSIAGEFYPVAREKVVEFTYEPGAGLGKEYAGDPFRIRQIADNLLCNAFKFTDRGSVTLAAKVESDTLCFSVRDTGRGIAEAEQERIFGEFVRLPSAQGVEGFGLGLSITRKLAELLGGGITLVSRVGVGSVFTVCLPLETGAVQNAKEADMAVLSQKLSCLWVDDDPLQLELTGAMCAKSGMDADLCRYPEYVAGMLGKKYYDIVFTDLQMPSMDGFTLLAEIRRVDDRIPVVVVSARSDIDGEILREKGFAGLLHKPFRLEELQACAALVAGKGVASSVDPGVSGELPAGFGALTAFAGEDREAAAEILRSFAEQSSVNCEAIGKALSEKDMASIRALAHKMQPIFAMLGDPVLTAALRSLELNSRGLTEEVCGQVRDATLRIGRFIESARKELTLLQNKAR